MFISDNNEVQRNYRPCHVLSGRFGDGQLLRPDALHRLPPVGRRRPEHVYVTLRCLRCVSLSQSLIKQTFKNNASKSADNNVYEMLIGSG